MNPRTRDLIDPRNTDQSVRVVGGEAPPPGEESVGPTMFDLVVELRRAREVSAVLMEQATNLLKRRTIVSKATGETNAAGSIDLPIYQVPQGYQLYVTRWNVEAVGFNSGAPFTSATASLFVFNGRNFGVGSMVDFLPNPPAANGNILPATQSDGIASAALFRGGEWISVGIRNGPVTTAIYARIQGVQEVV